MQNELQAAARHLIDRWDKGNLTEAVQRLAAALPVTTWEHAADAEVNEDVRDAEAIDKIEGYILLAAEGWTAKELAVLDALRAEADRTGGVQPCPCRSCHDDVRQALDWADGLYISDAVEYLNSQP